MQRCTKCKFPRSHDFLSKHLDTCMVVMNRFNLFQNQRKSLILTIQTGVINVKDVAVRIPVFAGVNENVRHGSVNSTPTVSMTSELH